MLEQVLSSQLFDIFGLIVRDTVVCILGYLIEALLIMK